MIGDFRCPHGHGPNDSRYAGIPMAAPYFQCKCCGRTQFYVDSAQYGTSGSSGRSWTPKDRCDGCGGRYVEWGRA